MTDENTQAEMPAETATPETQVAESVPAPVEADDAGQPEAPKKEHWANRRIDELTRNWRQEQREKQQLLEMLNQPKAPEKPAEPVTLPKLEEFGYDEGKYQAALIQYATQQAEQVVERRLSEAESKRVEQQRMGTFAERQASFAKANADYQAKVSDPTLPITAAMRDVIVDSDTGPEIAYWLANHREQAEQIAALPPHLAALELGRIEGRMEATREAKVTRPVITQAPPPTPTLAATEAPVKISPLDPESDRAMSDAEWVKAERARMNRKAKRNG